MLSTLTLLILSGLTFTPWMHLSMREPASRAAVEMAVTMIAALSGGLFLNRFRHQREGRDLTLGVLLLLAAVANLGVGVLGAHSASHEALDQSWLGSTEATLFARIAMTVLSCACALGLRRASRPGTDPAIRLLAFASTLAAIASLVYCSSPTFHTELLVVGDVLRLGALTLFLACGCLELLRDGNQALVSALTRERQRIAADVHDLVMQDLSFALANARTLVDDPARGAQASTVVIAGERALAGARGILSDLATTDSKPIGVTIRSSVTSAARHMPLSFDASRVCASAQPDLPTREALVHIARESVTNAVKHSRANAIEVVLEHDDEWRLVIHDDGRGFDTTTTSNGFGLTSMRRRARDLGGTLTLRSAIADGTTVEVRVP